MSENLSVDTPGSRSWTRYNGFTGQLEYGPVNTAEPTSLREERIVTKPERRPKPDGWLFPTPYAFEQLRVRYPYGRCVQDFTSYVDHYSGDLYGVSSGNGSGNMCPGGDTAKARPYPNVDHVSQAESQALNQFLTNGKAQEGTFSLGVAWAERKESADLLNSAANTCLSVLRHLRERRPHQAFMDLFPDGSPKDWKLLKDTPYWHWYRQNLKKTATATPQHVASAFLSLQNGWKPFLNDVSNAAESLANRNMPAYWVVTGTGFYKSQQTNVYQGRTFAGFNNRGDGALSYVTVKSVFCRIDATVSDDMLHTLAQLGLTNPASLEWDKTPLTYVFDYFAAVGAWLRSLEAALGMRFYSGSVTRYGSYYATLESMEKSAEVGFSGHHRWIKWDRQPYLSFPFPIAPLSMKPQPLKLAQFGNITSLAYLWLTGGKPSDLRG